MDRESEKEKEIRGERKRSYDLRDAKRENGEYWEKREIGLAGEKINEKIRLGSRQGGRLKKKNGGGKQQESGRQLYDDSKAGL